MGDVLIFAEGARSSRRRAVSVAGETAQILFFTGIRYQRDEATPSAAETRPSDGSGAPNGTGTGTRKRRA
jgi:hypothetical protein